MLTALILPAAGQSSRMRGRDKLLEDVGGQPCLRAMALRGLAAGLSVIVTLPDENHPRARALAEVPVRRLVVRDAARGMSESLRTAMAALPAATDAAIVLPPDMPDINRDDLTALIAMAGESPGALVVQASCADGTPGHPVLFCRALFGEFSTLTGDLGARDIIARHAQSRVLVPLAGQKARTDLDTPEDWAVWRAAQTAQGGG